MTAPQRRLTPPKTDLSVFNLSVSPLCDLPSAVLLQKLSRECQLCAFPSKEKCNELLFQIR